MSPKGRKVECSNVLAIDNNTILVYDDIRFWEMPKKAQNGKKQMQEQTSYDEWEKRIEADIFEANKPGSTDRKLAAIFISLLTLGVFALGSLLGIALFGQGLSLNTKHFIVNSVLSLFFVGALVALFTVPYLVILGRRQRS